MNVSTKPLEDAQSDSSSKPPVQPDGLDEMRELLFGQEKRELLELRKRLEDPSLRTQDLSSILPPAVALCIQKNDQLARALAPTVESAVKESIQKNPALFLSTFLPFLVPTVRKVITKSAAVLVLLNIWLLCLACYLISRSWPTTSPAPA